MGKSKKLASFFRGMAALLACLLVFSLVGSGIVEGYRGSLDAVLGTESYRTVEDETTAAFKSDYATIEEMAAAATSPSARARRAPSS